MNPKVDFYFEKDNKWQKEISAMRSIAIECNLNEELKWGCPCYTLDGRNIILIHTFKEYCAFLFFKGALLTDPEKLLIQQTENVQAARQLRFTGLPEIINRITIIKSYIFEAIELEKTGLKVPLKKTTEFVAPEEWVNALKNNSKLKTAFSKLTPGRQRAYLLHFSSPKQSATKQSRIEKATPDIMAGKGLLE